MKAYRTFKNISENISVVWFSILMLFVSTSGLFLAPVVVSAQNDLFPCSGANGITNTSGATNNRECTFNDVIELAQAIANKVVLFGLLLSPFIFAWAGWLYLTSGNNPGNRKKANGIFVNVLIGLAIMLGAWLVVKLVLTALVSSNITGNSAFPININS